MKDYRGLKIEYHILQSFPVTCLNRDDVGAPKTAVVGGIERGRVSSQCWKRQVRLALHDLDIHIAIRTKKIVDLIVKELKSEPDEKMMKYINEIATVLPKDTLLFISGSEIKALAEFAESTVSEDQKGKLGKAISNIMKKALKKGLADLDGLDIALFGRMVANAPDLNIQAASSFSHAITTHRISSSVDFFTAVDDFVAGEDMTVAGHLGSSEFTSGTYYRYISLDLGLLSETLGDDADMEKAIDAFTRALYIAVPAARQTTFAGYCPWDYARIYIRKGQCMQLSLDRPVIAKREGYLKPSIEYMDEMLGRTEKLMGSMFGKIDDFTYGETDGYDIDALCSDIKKVLASLPDKEA